MELTGFQECRPCLSCHYRQSSVRKLLGVLLLNSLICQCRWVFGLTNHAQTALRRNGVVRPVVFAFLQQRPGRPRHLVRHSHHRHVLVTPPHAPFDPLAAPVVFLVHIPHRGPRPMQQQTTQIDIAAFADAIKTLS